jgi:hypothetical protein
MSIENPSPEASESGRMGPGGDPLQMTEAEKRAAEWEARHDVAARGHRAGPDALQHYFTHERLAHAAQPHPAGGHASPKPRQPVQPAPAPPQPRVRGLLRRLFRRQG